MKETNINVRASETTKEQLKEIANMTGMSQADVLRDIINWTSFCMKQTGQNDPRTALIDYVVSRINKQS